MGMRQLDSWDRCAVLHLEQRWVERAGRSSWEITRAIMIDVDFSSIRYGKFDLRYSATKVMVGPAGAWREAPRTSGVGGHWTMVDHMREGRGVIETRAGRRKILAVDAYDKARWWSRETGGEFDVDRLVDLTGRHRRWRRSRRSATMAEMVESLGLERALWSAFGGALGTSEGDAFTAP